jgi:formylglycine-generating enzyme required for sulfatase activity
MVSWDDCQEFLRKAGGGLRLPTEAEWEYACRAGTKTRFSYGDDADYRQLGEYAWYASNSGNKTHPVGEKKPNGWGLYDVHGNVWEWCQDWYGEYAAGQAADPTGPASGSVRVLRGGCWFYFPQNCRSAYRVYDAPVYRDVNIGLRVVVVVGPGL